MLRGQVIDDVAFEDFFKQVGMIDIGEEMDLNVDVLIYPESWQFVERSLAGVSTDEREKMLYGNAMGLYRLMEQ